MPKNIPSIKGASLCKSVETFLDEPGKMEDKYKAHTSLPVKLRALSVSATRGAASCERLHQCATERMHHCTKCHSLLLFGKAAYYFMFQLSIQFDVAAIPLEVEKPAVRRCIRDYRDPIVCMCVYIIRWCMCVSTYVPQIRYNVQCSIPPANPPLLDRSVRERTTYVLLVPHLRQFSRYTLSLNSSM